jgi:Domain of unknown function (DUF4160)
MHVKMCAMPTTLRHGPYRFYFYSYDCAERRHTHIDRENMSAKFWLDPDTSLADTIGFSGRELRELERLTRQNLAILRHEWDEFCG